MNCAELKQSICDHLRGQDYRVLLDRKVGHMELDLVVEGSSGKRIAIAVHGDEPANGNGNGCNPAETLTRQLALERLGWTFVRVRASHFSSRPEQELQRLVERLEREGIEPSGRGAATQEPVETPDLRDAVVRRAESVRNRWKRVPTIPFSESPRAQTAS